MPQVLFAGLTTIDIQYFVEQFPGTNEKVKCAPPEVLVGGPAANAAAAYSFLNGESHLITAVGTNSFTSLIQADYNYCGIRAIDYIANKSVEPVLATVITSKTGERTIFSHQPEDHCHDVDIARLLETNDPEVLMIDGFYPALTKDLCREAKLRGIPVVLDAGSWKSHLSDILSYLNMVICSADFFPPDCTTHEEVINFFRNNGVDLVAVSRGEEALVYCDGTEIKEIPIDQKPIVDSLGAGDFLHGAFCYYWLQHKNFAEGLKKACHFATVSCQYPGTRICFTSMKRYDFV